MCAALAERGTDDDEPLLTDLFTDSDPDVRVAAAAALLRIEAPAADLAGLAGLDRAVGVCTGRAFDRVVLFAP